MTVQLRRVVLVLGEVSSLLAGLESVESLGKVSSGLVVMESVGSLGEVSSG